MIERKTQQAQANTPSRRQLIAGAAIAFGSFATGSSLWARAQDPAMKEPPSSPANQSRTSLRNEVEFKAAPQRIYDAILDSKQFAAFSGMAAEISPSTGGPISMFGGMIVGRNIELIPNQRIVQAWRPASWDPGVYSVVHFELKPNGPATSMAFDHYGFHSGDYDHLDWGWKNHYWEPLKKFFI